MDDPIFTFFTDNDHFARHSYITLQETSPGRATATMEILPLHRNGAGTVHGGAIFTLADFAFAVAANSHGLMAVAINTSITFTHPATTGVLTAQATELAVSRRIGTYAVEVRDGEGRLIAQFQGTAYRKDTKIPVENGR